MLISGSPDIEELESFSNYSQELKSYLIKNIDVPEIKDLANAIPNILEVEAKSKPIVILIALGLVTFGVSAIYISYAASMRKTRLIQGNIQTARGKYASIEFLLKAHY